MFCIRRRLQHSWYCFDSTTNIQKFELYRQSQRFSCIVTRKCECELEFGQQTGKQSLFGTKRRDQRSGLRIKEVGSHQSHITAVRVPCISLHLLFVLSCTSKIRRCLRARQTHNPIQSFTYVYSAWLHLAGSDP